MVRYSIQAVLLCFLLPLVIAFWLKPTDFFSLLNKDYWSRAFGLGYGAVMVVFFRVGVEREFFKTDEKWILSWRLLRSLVYTVLLPLAFGWFAFRIVEGVRSGNRAPVAWLFSQYSSVWSFVGSYVVLFVFLTVPHGFNQTYLLWAYKYSQREDVRKMPRAWWKLCFAFLVAPLLLALSIWFWL